MTQLTITPTEERVRLEISRERNIAYVIGVMTCWLERQAQRKHRHINELSVEVRLDLDHAARKSWLYAYADSFPDTLPGWLRTASPTR